LFLSGLPAAPLRLYRVPPHGITICCMFAACQPIDDLCCGFGAAFLNTIYQSMILGGCDDL
jgi:hypothetical protein